MKSKILNFNYLDELMGNIKEILLVVNPISGDSDKEHIEEKLEVIAKERDANLSIYHTKGENDIENVKKLTAEKTPQRIVVAGGDGTLKLVAEAVKGMDIPIGIIPSGSANGMALNLEIPKTLDKQLEVALGDNLLEVDFMCLNNEVGLHMSDLGINAELIKNYEDSYFRGKFGYMLQSIPTLIKGKYPYHFTVESEGETITEEGILLAFANAQKYGTGANINPMGRMDDGLLEILIFKDFDFVEIFKTLRNETDFSKDFVRVIPVKKATVTCRKPVSFQIDGEYIGEVNKVEVKLLPEKARIAVPRSKLERHR